MLFGTGFAGKCAFLVLAQTENNFIYVLLWDVLLKLQYGTNHTIEQFAKA